MKEFLRLQSNNFGIEHLNEVIADRTPFSKKFDLGMGQFNVQTSPNLIHYVDDTGNLVDIDLAPVDMGTYWQVDNAPFYVKIQKSVPSINFVTRHTNVSIDVTLASINGSSFSTPAPVFMPSKSGVQLCYSNILGNGHISFIINPNFIQTQQDILDPSALKQLVWTVSQNTSTPLITETYTYGYDAHGSEPEHIVNRTPLTQNGAVWEGTFTEYLTGNTLGYLDQKKRQKGVTGTVVYPVTAIS